MFFLFQLMSNKSKIGELERNLDSSRQNSSRKSVMALNLKEESLKSASNLTLTDTDLEESTPGMLGIIPPNTSDKIRMGLSSPTSELVISKDCYAKGTQTYETSFVACESCDIVQKRMKEAGEVVIKVCSEQGLPCSLKKLKSALSRYESIPYNDICRWMVEQNKDICRIGKQIEILQDTINPLKKTAKDAEKTVRLANEKAKSCEKSVIEEKEIQSTIRKQLEVLFCKVI